jgi:hypothetical protein
MALFTDGSLSDVQDLLAYEANLVEVADAESIDLEAKLRLAQDEIAAELVAAALGPVTLRHFTLDQVIVTSQLKLWHTFQTLAIAYRDAYNRKLNDKYLPKWSEYRDLSRWAANLLYQSGVGIALSPLPRPPQPALDTVPATLDALALYVRMTWLAASGAEGAPSLEAAFETEANQALRVTPPAAPAVVTGWNVYVGTTSGSATRQNGSPLDLSQPWIVPATGLVVGEPTGDGQEPDLFRTVPRFIQRG